MNSNIEVINKKLWAVRFSYLPYIQEIAISPDPSIPLVQEPGRIAPDGLFILNKDYSGYPLMRDLFPKLMKEKPHKLKMRINLLKQIKDKTPMQLVYFYGLQVELDRREKEGKPWRH